jgi:hypothetical protein
LAGRRRSFGPRSRSCGTGWAETAARLIADVTHTHHRGGRLGDTVPSRNPLDQTGPVHKSGTNEQPASNQAREPGTADGDETEESAGQDGCAARDLNPEPAD